MKLESVKKSHQTKYKYVATFCLCPNGGSGCEKPQKKEVYFGAEGDPAFTLGASDGDRMNYLARHRVNFDDPLTPGALSRYILWGESRDMDENVEAFKKRFNL